MRRKIMNKRGFTLIELVAVMAIFTIFSTFCVGVVQHAMAAQNRHVTMLKEQVALRRALLAAAKAVRLSDNAIGDVDKLLDGADIPEGVTVELSPDSDGVSVRVTAQTDTGVVAETMIRTRRRGGL